jgi:16S rRNA (cytosine967-C5)-methyltransferase
VIALVKSSVVSPARRVAFEILLRVEDGAFSSILLNSKTQELSNADRGLVHELVMGTLRRQLWLDRLADHYSERKSTALDPAIRVILRLGLYQLRFLSRIPDSAAVNESVNLVKHAKLRSATGLVNAVLRRATRERDVDPAAQINDPVERLAVSVSHPRWLIERWSAAFGQTEAEKFAAANNEPAPTAFRVVLNLAKEAEILEQLKEAGAVVEKSKVAEHAWRITGATDAIASLARAGKIYVQDEASQLVGEIVAADPGKMVLDLCAAPGSKATQIADRSTDSTVVAGDLYQHRLTTLVSSASLQGLTNLHTVTLNALQELPLRENCFDCVLVDAPCSGTGTLRRNPEIRWRISPADIDELSVRQRQILQNAAKVVKPGGRLIYSTCSVEREENEAVRLSFLENNKSFEPANLRVNGELANADSTVRTWPHRHGTDGFFMAAFRRAGN